MATPEKSTTIRGLDALGGVAAKIRIGELQSMDRKQFSKLVKDTLEPEKRTGTQSELINRIMEAEARTPRAEERQNVSVEHVDVKESEPEVNNELERSQEPVLDVVHSPNITEKREESLDQRLERENKITRFAREVEQDNFPSKPESIAFFNENEEKILGEVKFIKEGRVKNNELEQARRRKTSDKPFPAPAAPKPMAKEIAPAEPKIVEAPKAGPVLPVAPTERFKHLPQDQLGKAPEPKPEIDTEKEVERIARKLFDGKGDLTPDEVRFRGNHPEITGRLWKLHEEEQKSGRAKAPNETVKPTEILNKEKEPAPKLEPEKVLGGTEKDSTKENQKPIIDGNVEFQLGKLGIIDSSDPKQFEANKKLVVDKIKQEIPNFFNLSTTQQLYTLKQLERRTRRNITNDAEAEVGAANKENKKGGWFGRMYRKINQSADAAKLEKAKILGLKQKGFDGYKNDLVQLTNFVETRGLNVKQNEKGELALQFIERSGENKNHQALIDAFNDQASAFSNIPDNWTLEHATAYQKKRAGLAKAAYEKSRKALMAYESKNTNQEDKPAKNQEFTNTDAEIQMSRFLAENPGVEGAVNQFIKEHPMMTKGAFILLGAGAKGIAKYGSVFGGGLVASAALGGFTSWIRKRGEFREFEAQKRAGKDIGKVKGVKEGVDLVSYTKKINQLIEKAKNTEDLKKKTAILQSLQTRLTILKDRTQNLGVVSFGSRDEDLNNQFEYTRAVRDAHGLLIESSGIDKKISERIYKVFDRRYLKDADKDSERRDAVRKAFARGALIGGAGFVAGFIAADYLAGDDVATENAWNKMVEGTNPENVVDAPESVRLNPTTSPAGQPANFPGNMPRPESLPYDASEIVVPPPTPVVESSFGSRGAIGMIKDAQRALIAQYGENMPANLKEFAEGNPDRIAMDWGMYRPEDMNESISLPKGTTLAVMPDGSTILKLPDGKVIDGDFQADFFDSGARAESLASRTNNVEEAMAGTGVPGTETSPDGLVSDPTQVGDVQNTNNSVYGKGGFDEYKAARIAQGWEHTADGANGDVFTAAVDPDAARRYAPEFYPEEDVASTEPEVVPEYGDIDGLKVDSKELKGTVDFLYDSKGQVTGVDLPKLKVEDVSRFRATPERFIGGEHNAPERVLLTKKLLTVRSEVEAYLKYRRILEIESLSHDSDEYRFLNNESNRLWSSIQKKVEYQFNPQYSGVDGNPTENTGGAIAQEQAPVNSTIEAPRAESTSEFVKTGRDSIRLESQVYIDAASKYGEAVAINGNVVEFKDGYVGFYGESSDMQQAIRECNLAARTNAPLLGDPIESIAYPGDGKYRVLFVYKKP